MYKDMLEKYMYSKTHLKRPLKKKKGLFKIFGTLMQVESMAECSLLTCIKG